MFAYIGLRGGVGFDGSQKYFVLDNVCDGLDLYALDDYSWLKTFRTTRPLFRKPFQVAFVERGTVAVVGSDQGLVHLFDVDGGLCIGTLRHNRGGLMQALAVCCRSR